MIETSQPDDQVTFYVQRLEVDDQAARTIDVRVSYLESANTVTLTWSPTPDEVTDGISSLRLVLSVGVK